MNYRLVTIGYDNKLFVWTVVGHTKPEDPAGNRTYEIGTFDTLDEAVAVANTMTEFEASETSELRNVRYTVY